MTHESQTITQQEIELTISGEESELRTPDGLVVKINSPEAFRGFFSVENLDKPALIILSGTSESGKSTFGKLSVELGIGHRLKIYKAVRELAEAGKLPNIDELNPFDYASWLESDESLTRRASQEISSKYIQLMQETDVPIGVAETIKHPWMVTELKKIPTIKTLSLFIDADLNRRVDREVIKTGRDVQEVRYSVSEKDRWKETFGTAKVKDLSDVVIVNDGNYETYIRFVKSFLELLRRRSKPYSGIAREYS